MEIILLIIGIVLLVAGAALNISIKRRRFYRRGPGGLQHFESYGKAVTVTFMEKIGKVAAILLIIAGLFFISCYFIYPDMKQKIEAQKQNKNDQAS